MPFPTPVDDLDSLIEAVGDETASGGITPTELETILEALRGYGIGYHDIIASDATINSTTHTTQHSFDAFGPASGTGYTKFEGRWMMNGDATAGLILRINATGCTGRVWVISPAITTQHAAISSGVFTSSALVMAGANDIVRFGGIIANATASDVACTVQAANNTGTNSQTLYQNSYMQSWPFS